MGTNASDFSNVLKNIIENSEGIDALKDKNRTKNFLRDFAPGDSFQKEKKLLDDAYSCNAVSFLLNAGTSFKDQQKAIETARTKLVDNMSISEEGANSIIKDICDALDWNTSKLFASNSVKKQSISDNKHSVYETNKVELIDQPTIPENKSDDMEVVKYVSAYKYRDDLPSPARQIVSNNSQTEHYPASVQPMPIIERKQKKKSNFVTVLKVIGVLLIISLIYNAITGNKSDDNIIAEDQEAAGGRRSSADDSSQTNSNEGYYVVTDIAKLGYYDLKDYQPLFISYVSETDTIYYVDSSCDLHEYNLSGETDNIILSSEEIDIALDAYVDENSLVPYEVIYSDITVIGLTYNNYNNQLYMYGYGLVNNGAKKVQQYWIYEISSGRKNWFQTDYNIPVDVISFFNDDEFAALHTLGGYSIINFTTGEYRYVNGLSDFHTPNMYIDYLFDIDDNYYVFVNDTFDNFVRFYKVGNIYNPEFEEIFYSPDYTYGATVKDNKLYYKEQDNNVLELDIYNRLKGDYIPIDGVYQTSKSYLSENQCTGLYITNDGGYITYDSTDGRIKYISKDKGN